MLIGSDLFVYYMITVGELIENQIGRVIIMPQDYDYDGDIDIDDIMHEMNMDDLYDSDNNPNYNFNPGKKKEIDTVSRLIDALGYFALFMIFIVFMIDDTEKISPGMEILKYIVLIIILIVVVAFCEWLKTKCKK